MRMLHAPILRSVGSGRRWDFPACGAVYAGCIEHIVQPVEIFPVGRIGVEPVQYRLDLVFRRFVLQKLVQ